MLNVDSQRLNDSTEKWLNDRTENRARFESNVMAGSMADFSVKKELDEAGLPIFIE